MYLEVPVTYERYPPVRCWQPLGFPVLPLVYMRNSGASASMGTGGTILPANLGRISSTQKSRPFANGEADALLPACRLQTKTLSTSWPDCLAKSSAMSAPALWSNILP